MSAAYLYETHMHTRQASACSDTPGRDYIQKYIDFGYDGIIITDHFWRGNCGVDRTLPWPDFVRQFVSGYEEARDEGEKRGLKVFFGWEENFEGDEYLIYGLDGQFMLNHPEMIRWTRRQQYDAVHAAGGCVVQAHPFRSRGYNHGIFLSPFLSDGIEGFNAGNEMKWNSQAMRYAHWTGLPVTAGSDNHHAYAMKQENLAGVAFDQPLNDIADYVRAILEKRPFAAHLPVPVPDWTEDMAPDLPAFWLDEMGERTDKDVQQMLLRGL